MAESNSPVPGYSVVIPLYNEAELIPVLHERLSRAMQPLGSYEILYVNDGSHDSTVTQLRQLNKQDARVKLVNLSRNFGHQTAISAGLWFARGFRVIIMDGDLQDPPEVIPALAKKCDEGYDVVFGIRRRRKEWWPMRLAYYVFYRVLRRTANIDIPLDAGDFCIMRRRVADLVNQMPERNRFVRGLRSWVGLRQVGLPYERDSRFAGKAKYTLAKLLRLSLDGLFSFSYVPLRLATYLGFAVSVASFIAILFVLYWRLVTKAPLFGYASLATAILFLGGLQMITIGTVGEYLGRVYDEVKQRPLWVVEELVGFGAESADSQPGKTGVVASK